jgi:hypothetical protein
LKSQIEAQKEIRQYLLGTLSPEQAAEFEARLLIDTEIYEELLIAEDELIDQFIEGEIAPAEREAVEKHFLQTPERMKQLTFARMLKSYVSANTSPTPEVSEPKPRAESVSVDPLKKRSFRTLLFPRNPALGFSLAGALLLIIIGGVWMANRLLNRTSQPQTVWAVELTPGLQRDGGEITSFAIPGTADITRLELDLSDDQYPSYQVEVLDIDGRSVMTGKNLKAQTAKGRRIVQLEVKSALLSPGAYRAKLSGLSADGKLESLETYPFKILRK